MNAEEIAKYKEAFDKLDEKEKANTLKMLTSFSSFLHLYTSCLYQVEQYERKGKLVEERQCCFSEKEIENFYEIMQVIDKLGYTLENQIGVLEYALAFYMLAFRSSALEFRYIRQTDEVLKDYKICFDVICRVAIKLNIPLFSKDLVKYTEAFLIDILNQIYLYKNDEPIMFTYACLFVKEFDLCLDNDFRNIKVEQVFFNDIKDLFDNIPLLKDTSNSSPATICLRGLLISTFLRGEQFIVSRDSLPILFDVMQSDLRNIVFIDKKDKPFFIEPTLKMLNAKRNQLVSAGVDKSAIDGLINNLEGHLHE